MPYQKLEKANRFQTASQENSSWEPSPNKTYENDVINFIERDIIKLAHTADRVPVIGLGGRDCPKQYPHPLVLKNSCI